MKVQVQNTGGELKATIRNELESYLGQQQVQVVESPPTRIINVTVTGVTETPPTVRLGPGPVTILRLHTSELVARMAAQGP